jgi:hypothetical protein
MSLPWVKLHTTLLDNETYADLSSEAQHTFLTCLMLAGKQDVGDYSGRLVTDLRPMVARDIARKTRYTVRKQEEALHELLAAGWLSTDLTGTLIVERFEEKAAPLASNRERQRTLRERRRNVTKTGQKQIVEAEAEGDSSLRSEPGRNVTPLDLHERRRAILTAVWDLVAPALSGTITKTGWGKQNSAVALDLAKAGVEPQRCIAAWHSATKRLGSPVRTLRIVQDELGRLVSAPAPSQHRTITAEELNLD